MSIGRLSGANSPLSSFSHTFESGQSHAVTIWRGTTTYVPFAVLPSSKNNGRQAMTMMPPPEEALWVSHYRFAVELLISTDHSRPSINTTSILLWPWALSVSRTGGSLDDTTPTWSPVVDADHPHPTSEPLSHLIQHMHLALHMMCCGMSSWHMQLRIPAPIFFGFPALSLIPRMVLPPQWDDKHWEGVWRPASIMHSS